MLNLILCALALGVGATLFMDLAALMHKALGLSTLNMRFVGRWLIHLMHANKTRKNSVIWQSPAMPLEHLTGWLAHYLIGIVFALLLLLFTGTQWLYQPTLEPALVVGIISLIAPFFIMQPGFGLGFAANKTANPNLSRLMSLLAHTEFALGLYLTALLISHLAH
ncbi:DUF2938 family protein [Pseudomonas sp. F1_0610]|uniref:DUF2938 family protein n=1 Tax=Pseudomonas sp. F1_0610 TaxID=3114284 RepID=UPI0039C37B1E